MNGIETTTERTCKITMILDENHARWLEANMQNPLHGQSPLEELQYDTEMRKDFFNAMNNALADRC